MTGSINFNKLKTGNILLFLSLFVVFFSFYLYLVPCVINSDSGWGFVTLKSYLRGGPFNFYKLPDATNIAKDACGLNYTWTPGQYLIPGLFMFLFHASTGSAILAAIIFCSASGLVGLYKLFLLLGFSEKVSAFSLLVIACQRYFSVQFTIYQGGELALFAGLPWIIICFIKCRDLAFYQVAVLIAVSILGFVLKNTFLIAMGSLCLFLVINRFFPENPDPSVTLNFRSFFSKRIIYYGLKVATLFAITWLLIFKFYFKGINIVTDNSFHPSLVGFLFPLSSTIASCFSIDDLINKFFIFPDMITFSTATRSINPLLVYLPLALINITGIVYLLKKSPGRIYTQLFICFAAFYMAFFINIDINHKGGDYYNMRYFRITGLLFVPLLINVLFHSPKLIQLGLIVFIGVFSLYGFSSVFHHKNYIAKNYTLGAENFYIDIDKEALDFIHKTDQDLKSGNNIFYVTTPELVLEIKNNRYIPMHADFMEASTLASLKYHGKVDKLYLVLQKKLEEKNKISIIENSFIDYHTFTTAFESENDKVILCE